MEKPDVMLDQYLRNMNSDLSEVKADTANVMAIQKGIERKISICERDITSLSRYAMFAISAGNDEDARRFLGEKARKKAEIEELMASLELAISNSEKMRQMHNKLSDEVRAASEKTALLKSKVNIAKTQETINKTVNQYTATGKSFAEFSALENKINTSLDRAFALEELNSPSDESIDALKSKYSAVYHNGKVEVELSGLKEMVG